MFGLTCETTPLKNSRLKVFLNLFEPPRTTLILCDNQTWQWEIRHGHSRLKGHHTLRIFHCHMKETGEALETVAVFRPLVASWLVVQYLGVLWKLWQLQHGYKYGYKLHNVG